MNRRFKKMIAIVSAIAMVVCSVTVYNTSSVNASGSATVDGIIYTVTDGDTDIVEFTCQGIFDSARIHFAWGTALDADTITATVNGEDVAVDGKNANGMFIPLSEVSDLGEGEYSIVVTGTSQEDPEKTLTGNATLKIESQGETTTRDPSVVNWIDLGQGYSYDDSTTASIVNIQQPGFATELGIYMTVPAGISEVSINGDTSGGSAVQGAGVVIYLSALVLKTNEVVITYAGGTATVKIANANGVDASETTTPEETTSSDEETTPEETTSADEETTPEETTSADEETIDPSEITEWTLVTGSSNIYYNIYDNEAKVSVKPQIEMIDGKNTVYTGFSLPGPLNRVVINGVDVAEEDMPDGSFIRLFVEKLTEEYYTIVVYDHYGTESVTILLKVEEEPETTTAAPVADDTEILLNTQFIGADNWNHDNMISFTDNGDGSMSCVVEEKTGGATYSTQLVQNGITLEEGKWYVAKYTVSSDVDKNFRLLIQSDGNAGGDWSEFGGLVTSVKAGQEVEVTLKFQATKTANGNALYGIMMGYIDETNSAEANVTVKSVSLKGYSAEPEVETGSVVVKEPEQEDYKVTVDNEKVSVVDNKVTLGDAAYGYFCDGKMYAPNSEVTVEADMAFTSVKELSVSMANGAGIRYIGTAGIRFQSSIVSDNMDAVASDAITEGTLITASDIYEAKGEELTLTSDYTKLNVTNSGWYNETVGTYCGSICDVVESNYIRNFTARAYVTINYENSDAVTVYSSMGPVRSISQVASAVKAAGYAGIAEEYKSTIDSFIK